MKQEIRINLTKEAIEIINSKAHKLSNDENLNEKEKRGILINEAIIENKRLSELNLTCDEERKIMAIKALVLAFNSEEIYFENKLNEILLDLTSKEIKNGK